MLFVTVIVELTSVPDTSASEKSSIIYFFFFFMQVYGILSHKRMRGSGENKRNDNY